MSAQRASGTSTGKFVKHEPSMIRSGVAAPTMFWASCTAIYGCNAAPLLEPCAYIVELRRPLGKGSERGARGQRLVDLVGFDANVLEPLARSGFAHAVADHGEDQRLEQQRTAGEIVAQACLGRAAILLWFQSRPSADDLVKTVPEGCIARRDEPPQK